MDKHIRQVSGIVMAGAAALFLSACTTTGYNEGYYDQGQGQGQNSYVTFQQANPDEVRYAITRDMYMQGYYLTNDNNPLVFERPLAGYRDMERVTFWLEAGYDGTRVMVDQLYFIYSGNGWRESRDWSDPYRPIFMPSQLQNFHREYYSQPQGYWQHERERDRGRDWTRSNERQRWEADQSYGDRRPALPPVQTQPPQQQERRGPFRGQQPSQQPQQQHIMRDMREGGPLLRQQQQQGQPQQQQVQPQQQQPQQEQIQQYRQQMEKRQLELKQQQQNQQQQQQQQQDQQQQEQARRQQMRDLQDRWRQQHQEQPGQPQQQQYRQQMERPQQEQMRPQQLQQMREERQRQQPPEAPKSPQQQQKQQKQQPQDSGQPQPQSSGPSQKQIDEVRERFRGKNPY